MASPDRADFGRWEAVRQAAAKQFGVPRYGDEDLPPPPWLPCSCGCEEPGSWRACRDCGMDFKVMPVTCPCCDSDDLEVIR